jgi:phytoene synthase
MLRRHDPTYYLATRRLPAPIQPATYALYGYVRAADQLVDGPRRPATATNTERSMTSAPLRICSPAKRESAAASASYRIRSGSANVTL